MDNFAIAKNEVTELCLESCLDAIIYLSFLIYNNKILKRPMTMDKLPASVLECTWIGLLKTVID